MTIVKKYWGKGVFCIGEHMENNRNFIDQNLIIIFLRNKISSKIIELVKLITILYMENNHFLIDRKIRELISTDRRIYSIIFGIFVLIVGLIPIVKNGLSIQNEYLILHEIYTLVGILQIIFGVIGKELFTIRHRLELNSESIKIKKTFQRKVLINLDSITHLKMLPFSLEFCFGDYVKTYEFLWLTQEEFERLKIAISIRSANKNIVIE